MDDILISKEVEEALKAEVPLCTADFNVISGFCKLQTLMFLNGLCRQGIKKRLLVRFLPSDLSSGATDKEIYSYCKSNGWAMYIDHTIHAKTYIFDKVKCIIGSANATNRGIGSGDNYNKEVSAYFKLDDYQYTKVMTLYKDAILLDDDLYNCIISQMDDQLVINKVSQKRNHNESIECLMREDFPDENADIVELHNSKAYKWLKTFLASKEESSAYFGELSSVVHNLFLKEPNPYRKDIKDYLKGLLSSIKNNQDPDIKIERPNFSEKVTLVNN